MTNVRVSAPARPDAAPLRPVEWALIAAVWAFYGAMSVATQVIDRRGGPSFGSDGNTALRLLVNPAVWAVLTAVVLSASRRVTLDRKFWRSRGIIVVIAGILVANSFDLVSDALWDALAPTSGVGAAAPGRRFNPGLGNLSWLDDLGVFFAALTVATARGYILREQARRDDARRRAAESEAQSVHMEAHAAHLQAQLAEAQLDALRRQLDPHFLFNTLNTVSALVERDPPGVRRMIGQLSDLLRHSIEASSPEIPLRLELELLERYVDIMRVRFDDRLEITVRADPAALDGLVPNLILQPLVENAIKHGVEQRSDGGRVDVEAKLDGESLVLRVRDNGPGMSPWSAADPEVSAKDSDNGRRGVGLRNTATRLAALYGAGYRFTVGPDSAGGSGTLAEVRLPYHVAGDGAPRGG
jgi:two-component system LytT family sensor kinase